MQMTYCDFNRHLSANGLFKEIVKLRQQSGMFIPFLEVSFRDDANSKDEVNSKDEANSEDEASLKEKEAEERKKGEDAEERRNSLHIINGIKLSPTISNEKVKESVGLLTQKFGFPHCEIGFSEIPFRII